MRNLIAGLSDSLTPSSLPARLGHGIIVLIAVVMGLQQMGIDITFITQLVLALVVIVLGGLTLAFALGAREYVANLVARSEIQRYAVGDHIRVGMDEGTIVEIHKTGIDLATSVGIAAIPAARFARGRVLRVAPGEGAN